MQNGELVPLLPTLTTHNSPSFFQKLKRNPMQTIKKIGLAGVSAFSGYMYWPSSFSAAASISSTLQYPAALGGSITNSIFNYESFLSLAELPKFRSMPWKYITATLFSIACVTPNFLMNIYDDEKQEYVDNTQMALQACTAFLNIWVNIVGTLELIQNVSSLVESNNLDTQKKELIERINQAIESFYQLPIEKQTEARLNNILNPSKLTYYSLNAVIGALSLPQCAAYVLISYFGMKNLAEYAWNINKTTSIILGSIAAIGNGIPGAGFTIKGVNSISKKLISLEKPSLLAAFFVLPALFSGFTTHKAMADSLKEMRYSGRTVEILNWISNLGAVFFFNFPQMLALANRFGKKTPAANDHLELRQLQAQAQNLGSTQNIKEFETNLPHHISRFFSAIVNDTSITRARHDNDLNTFRLSIQ
ncbi:MAG: hypothetical protein WA659_07000 [Candidatus Aquirickettsiella sp.]